MRPMERLAGPLIEDYCMRQARSDDSGKRQSDRTFREEREDITGDHVHSVSFCIGLTSTEKKLIKDTQSSSKFSTHLSCNIIS